MLYSTTYAQIIIRYGDTSTSLIPSNSPPPTGRSDADVDTSAVPHLDNCTTQPVAASRKAPETSSRFTGPRGTASSVVTAGPAIAPEVPPAAMNPYRRRACAVS